MSEPGRTGIRKRVLAKLFILLSSGPIINKIGVAIVQESEATLNIRESDFWGLGWCLNTDFSIAEPHQFTEACKRYNISSAFQDEALVEFSSCNSLFAVYFEERYLNNASISVGVSNQTEFAIFAIMFEWKVFAFATTQLLSEKSLFQMKHALTNETAAALVDRGIKLISEECRIGDERDGTEDMIQGSFHGLEIITSKTIPCQDPIPVSEAEAIQKAKEIAGTLREHPTFVNAEKFELFVDDENRSEVSAVEQTVVDNISFQIRRQRNLSIASVMDAVTVSFLVYISGQRFSSTTLFRWLWSWLSRKDWGSESLILCCVME